MTHVTAVWETLGIKSQRQQLSFSHYSLSTTLCIGLHKTSSVTELFSSWHWKFPICCRLLPSKFTNIALRKLQLIIWADCSGFKFLKTNHFAYASATNVNYTIYMYVPTSLFFWRIIHFQFSKQFSFLVHVLTIK